MATSLLRQIKASAGSGKTHDLTSRFLQHLAAGAPRPHAPSCTLASQAGQSWGDILAITFTNSAAAEMKERVIRRLKEKALEKRPDPDTTQTQKDAPPGISPATAKVWVDTILRQYGALNIRTIDSLLHLVVRTAALDLGLPPDFETTFATDETLTPIFDALLEKAWQGDAEVEALIQAVCRARLYQGKAAGFMAGKSIITGLRPVLDYLLTHQDDAPLSSLEAIQARHAALLATLKTRAADMLRCQQQEGFAFKKAAVEAIQLCADGDAEAANSACLAKESIGQCLLAAGKNKATDRAEALYQGLATAAEAMRNAGHILHKAMQLLPFVVLAKAILQELEEFQQRENKIPGSLMPLMAGQVLQMEHGVPSALCRLGSNLQHLLVDEFQDTSAEQWQALHPLVCEALSRGGSLTIVGDIKQAIYGWRGGDASLFDAILQDPTLLCMAPDPSREHLPTNWRSLKVVVQHNNAFFAPLTQPHVAREVLTAMLAKECPPTVLDQAAHRLAHVFTHASQNCRPKDAEGGFVTLREVRAEKSEELAEEVRQALQERLVEDLGQRRRWGDITILVRSNTAASQVAHWLMEWGVPVITENSLLLGQHPLVAETVAFLSFLDSPQDDLSFWTVLTGSLLSPCLASTDDDATTPSLTVLREWAMQRRKGFLSMAFRDKWPKFWQRWFAPFHGKAGLMTPYDIVQEWYGLLRVSQRFPEASTFLRRLLEVLHAAGERGAATLNTFLHYWQENGGDEKAPMPEGMDAVRVMTIHKSKGLQFPVVIVPWMSFVQKEDYPPVPYTLDGLHLLAPRCRQMGDIFHQAQALSAMEAINLLYVAMTRAEEELHLFHTHTPYLLRMRNLACGLQTLLPAAGLEAPYSDGQPATPPKATAHDTTQVPAQEWTPSATQAPTEPQMSEEVWRPMQWLPRLKIFRNPLQELAFSKKRFGILTHHCLERLQATGDPTKDVAAAVSLGLRTFPLPLPPGHRLEEDITRALLWYATLPGAQDWISQGLPEQSLVDTQGKEHRVDLLIPPHTTHSPWRAIDYKTGEEDKDNIKQMRHYLSLLDAMSAQDPGPHKAAQGMLVYLNLQGCRMLMRDHVSELLPLPAWDMLEAIA